MPISIAFHIVGFSLWVVSLMLVTNLLKNLCSYHAPQSIDISVIGPLLKRVGGGFIIGGMCLTVISGIYQFIMGGAAVYMKQGWFHTKLTLVVLLLILSFITLTKLAQVARGEKVLASTAGKLHALSGFLLIAIVFLTLLGR